MPRQLTRRRVLIGSGGGAGASALALTLGACAAPGSAPAGQSQAPVKICVVTRGGGDGTGMEQVIIPAFSKQFENITVEHASLGGEPDYWAKVVTGHLGKDLADVVWASTGGFNALAFRGTFKELEPLARADRYDFKDYVQAGLDTLKVRGSSTGSPGGATPATTGLLYNEELLQQAPGTSPRTPPGPGTG